MGGWRDEDGRTAADRKRQGDVESRARFASDLRHQPLSVLKGFAGLALVLVLVFALIGFLR